MKFDQNEHDVEQFKYDLSVLGKMIGMSDEQFLQHFIEAFLAKFEAQLLKIKINNTDIVMRKARVLILSFKSELPQSTSSSMLAPMREMKIPHTQDKTKHIS